MKWICFFTYFLTFAFCGQCFGVEQRPTAFSQETSQVILITGASRGIGWETAKKLASQGHRVYAGVRSFKSLAGDRELSQPALQYVELDVTDDASVSKAVEMVHQKEGRLDVLINNAGCAVFGPLEVIAIDQAKTTFEVNFFGTMRMMQAALPIMRKQNKGLIINLSSTSGVRPSPGWDIYGASKFAIEGLSEAVAALAQQWNIDVVVVEPGTTSTDFMDKSTVIGSRRTAETLAYDNFMANAIKWMRERLADGQNPEEVAGTISSVVASESRHFRYQTSTKGKQTVAARHCDPTGDSSIKEQGLLIQQLWQGQLEPQKGSSYR